jgi:hypothetical protein
MSNNNLEFWDFPEPVEKVKIIINNQTIIGFPKKRPLQDVLTFSLSKSTEK